MAIPITRVVIPRETPSPNQVNKISTGILQTPFEDPYNASNAQLHIPKLITQEAVQFQ